MKKQNSLHFSFSISISKFHLGFNVASFNVALIRKQPTTFAKSAS